MKSKIIGAEHLMYIRPHTSYPFFDTYTQIFNTSYEYNRKQNAFLCDAWEDACLLDYMKYSKWLFKVRAFA